MVCSFFARFGPPEKNQTWESVDVVEFLNVKHLQGRLNAVFLQQTAFWDVYGQCAAPVLTAPLESPANLAMHIPILDADPHFVLQAFIMIAVRAKGKQWVVKTVIP
jgi:hypothetical protein